MIFAFWVLMPQLPPRQLFSLAEAPSACIEKTKLSGLDQHQQQDELCTKSNLFTATLIVDRSVGVE